MERLNFKSSNLSERLNRILHKFVKGAITSKLDDFKNKLGITITEINPAYTSQTCNSCGYIAKNNRKSRDEFICVCCNKKSHADINASRNIFGRSSTPLKDIYLSKAFILDKLITRFIERQRSHYNLASLIVNNKYFNNYQQTLVE
ncbi:zinc ribbon domain-containing protein [Campylobacter ureolyticus]|nr:zinc ribbon domain-containing protein [Campylobacter ureolyticus]MCR8685387.1 transposase [Campylobacter ureolyticus]QQY36442.1 transposase [Campylobacter ureolyticus]SUX19776.1 transposase, IS605 family [Campylobacter ureolyticus]